MTAMSNAHDVYQRFHEDVSTDMYEGAGVLADSSNVLKDGVSSIGWVRNVPAAAAVVSGSAVIGGVAGTVAGGLSFRNSFQKIRFANSVHDGEGVFHHASFAGSATGYTAMSALMAVEGGMSLANIASPAAVGISLGSIGLTMYGALVAYSVHGLIQGTSFTNALKEKKEVGIKETCLWLKDQIGLKDGDTTKEILKKWSIFERRTDLDCVKYVKKELEPLLEKFDEEKAKVLIEKVEKANFKKRVKFALLIMISIIGISSFITMLTVTGPISTAFFITGAILWFTVDLPILHNYIGEKCWVWHARGKEVILSWKKHLLKST